MRSEGTGSGNAEDIWLWLWLLMWWVMGGGPGGEVR